MLKMLRLRLSYVMLGSVNKVQPTARSSFYKYIIVTM